MKQNTKHYLARFLEHELLILIALVLLLGILFGYSLAAAQTASTDTTLQSPTQIMRSSLGSAGDDVD